VGRWLRDLAAHKYLYRVSAKTITKYDLWGLYSALIRFRNAAFCFVVQYQQRCERIIQNHHFLPIRIFHLRFNHETMKHSSRARKAVCVIG
jgi:hypothetical protein